MMKPEEFDAVVAGHLVPPLERLGLRGVPCDKYGARLESDSAVVVVELDAFRTAELLSWIGRPGDRASLLALDALEPALRTPTVAEASGLAVALDRIVSFLLTDHFGLLAGDPMAFADALHRRSEAASENVTRVLNAPLLARADEAWHEGDFARVVQVLGPIRGSLSPTHLRRLQFAERKLEDRESR